MSIITFTYISLHRRLTTNVVHKMAIIYNISNIMVSVVRLKKKSATHYTNQCRTEKSSWAASSTCELNCGDVYNTN